jgi:hypothetical protein
MSFFSSYLSTISSVQLEKIIVMAVKGRMLSVRLDHHGACLRFGEQVLESDALRRQLTLLATQLQKVPGKGVWLCQNMIF